MKRINRYMNAEELDHSAVSHDDIGNEAVVVTKKQLL